MFKKIYKHLFFDLDRTLWDFDSSSRQTFDELFRIYHLDKYGIASVDAFTEVYHKHNNYFWDLYRKGAIKKEVLRGIRFVETLKSFNIDNPELADNLTEDYLYHSPRNVFLFPNTHETLTYLQKKVTMHLITNGFDEVQKIKLEESGLRKYFTTVVTSEEAGVKKPDIRIFEFAMNKAQAQATESLMVGDDLEADIEGARQVGMDQVFFNPEKVSYNDKTTFEIADLIELCNYF